MVVLGILAILLLDLKKFHIIRTFDFSLKVTFLQVVIVISVLFTAWFDMNPEQNHNVYVSGMKVLLDMM